MDSAAEFAPNWASCPGATISAALRERRTSIAAFAGKMGVSEDEVGRLLTGSAPLTEEHAAKLHHLIGGTTSFWIKREAEFRKALTGMSAPRESPEATYERCLPVADMARFGWIPPVTSRNQRFSACLEFFGVDSSALLIKKQQQLVGQAAFRTSTKLQSDRWALAAWLRQGERLASDVACSPWDKARFVGSLPEIRKMTRIRDPGQFLPALTAACALTGVALVVVRSPAGCRASGATRFMSPDRPVLQLSFRFLSDDHFWFTFFHEAAHLALHSQSSTFIEEERSAVSPEETEANEFASDALIPEQFRERLETLELSRHAIRHFALSVGTSPGVVVGQLQHMGRVSRGDLNVLKARYKWTDNGGRITRGMK